MPIKVPLVASLALLVLLHHWHKKSKKQPPLPPGPKGYPVVGNLFDVPSKAMWKKLHEWCEEYGSDIIHINMAGQSLIALDSEEAATDLFEKRSAIYSDRTKLPVIHELMGFSFNFAFIQYGSQW